MNLFTYLYNLFLYVSLFISGLFIGSFLNLVADRLVFGEPILFGRSKCSSCKKNLIPADLIPLFSFLFLRGRCRYCKTNLSFSHPISEILTGSIFVGVAYYLNIFKNFSYGITILFAYILVIACVYLVIFFADAKYKIIPDQVVFFGIAVILLFTFISTTYNLWLFHNSLLQDEFGKYLIKAGFWNNQLIFTLKTLGIWLLSSILISLFFWLLIFITKGRGMGFGDVKLGFLIGLFNGFPNNVLAIFLGFLFGAVYSLILIFLRKKSMRDTIPFGPFLILGSIVSFVFGKVLLNWYFSFF